MEAIAVRLEAIATRNKGGSTAINSKSDSKIGGSCTTSHARICQPCYGRYRQSAEFSQALATVSPEQMRKTVEIIVQKALKQLNQQVLVSFVGRVSWCWFRTMYLENSTHPHGDSSFHLS